MSRRSLKLGSNATTTMANASSSALQELEQFNWDYSEISDRDERVSLQSATIEIKGLLRQTVENAIEIGKRLNEARDILGYGKFPIWLHAEFIDPGIFARDTANNYMNLWKLSQNYSLEQLKTMPLNALYLLARSTVPEEARAESFVLAESGSISRDDVKEVVQRYRQVKLEEARVSPEAAQLLLETSIAENPDELKRIARLPQSKQLEVARHLQSSETDLSVRQALSASRSNREINNESAVAVQYVQTEAQKGDWSQLIRELEPESVDLVFAEFPLHRSALPSYRDLAEGIYPALKPGGMVLSIVGQQNIQFVGPELEPLDVAWTFMIRRTSGRSPRVVGRITFASSYIPLSLAYKPPYPRVLGLIDDMRLEKEADETLDVNSTKIMTPAEAMRLNLDAPSPTERSEPTSIEDSVAYYLQQLLPATGNFLHLVTNQQFSFNLGTVIEQAAIRANAGRVMTIVQS